MHHSQSLDWASAQHHRKRSCWGVSEPQLWRFRAAYRPEGNTGLTNANRGREANRQFSNEVWRRVVELARSKKL